jgi:hypothetical protein
MAEEQEEVTRCMCGQQDYPGDEKKFDGAFVQCDECKVWQHIGCVHFPREKIPQEYFCELCKPDLHQQLETSTG